MRYLKPFNESKKFLTDPREIMLQLERIAPIKQGFNEPGLFDRITIHPDGTVDVSGGGIVLCMEGKRYKLPIKFGRVDGPFKITGCQGLTTLEGSPRECGSFFAYYLRELRNLEGGPQIVNGDFEIEGSGITTLVGGPKVVYGNYNVQQTRITSLEGSPRTCVNFNCKITEITNLVGGPEITRMYQTLGCPLTSLEGAPKESTCLVLGSNILDPRPLKGCRIDKIDFFNYSSKTFLELVSLFNTYEPSYRNLRNDLSLEVTKRFLDSLDYNYVRGDSLKPQINLFRLKEALSEFDIIEAPWDYRESLINYELIDDEGRVVDFPI